jgi:syntaxin 18
LGALGRWAAGGAITAKSPEEEAEEAKINTIKAHRESIIWYLQRALEECGRFQSSMMEIRLTREVEKSKSVLYKARGTMPATTDFGGMNGSHGAEVDYRGSSSQYQEAEAAATEQQLDQEQLQLFAQENQDMLKHYEDHLDQVRYVRDVCYRPPCLTGCLGPPRSLCLRYRNCNRHWRLT